MSFPAPSRREFLAYGTGFWIASRPGPAQEKGPNSKLAIGVIGADGMGYGNVKGVSSETIAALCDVDEARLAKAAKDHPKANRYIDYRVMLDKEKGLDALVVSTPDHTHAVATMAALKLGKHVYCEKPLTHSVWEARTVAAEAARSGKATQMGTRMHASEVIRRTVEFIQAGAVGPVREVHAWTDRPIWPQGIDRPEGAMPTPPLLNWDLWLGPAPERPYHSAYHPFSWRGWWDFGTGALGDMACHILDAPFWALKLGAPATIEAEGEPRKPETGPLWSTIRYEFPARAELPPVKLTWYEGRKGKDANGKDLMNLPPPELFRGAKADTNGVLFVGDKGALLYNYGAQPLLLPREDFADFKPPAPTLPRAPGNNHYQDWIQACKGGPKAGSSFDYAGPLTELVLLGVAAFRAGQRIEWDAANLKAPEAESFIRREYRKGWSL